MGSEEYISTLENRSFYDKDTFKIKDVALRLHAGVGSLGAPRYYALLEGETSSDDDDVILDIKAQSSPSGFLNVDPDAISITNIASSSSPGKRVVSAARAMGQNVDSYLGYITIGKFEYTVRERNPKKDTFDADDEKNKNVPQKISNLSQAKNHFSQIGKVLAAAHSRANKNPSSSGIAYSINSNIYKNINGNHSNFKRVVQNIAFNYAEQVDFDHAVFLSHKNNANDEL